MAVLLTKVGARRPAGRALPGRAAGSRALLAAAEAASRAEPASRDKLSVLRSRGGGFGATRHPSVPGPGAWRWSETWASGCQTVCASLSVVNFLSVCSRCVGRERPGGTAVSPPAVAPCPRVSCVCPSLSPRVSVCVRDSMFYLNVSLL